MLARLDLHLDVVAVLAVVEVVSSDAVRQRAVDAAVDGSAAELVFEQVGRRRSAADRHAVQLEVPQVACRSATGPGA